MGHTPIQTVPSPAAHPLWCVGASTLCAISSTHYTVLHKGLSIVFVHRAATPDAHGQLFHDALLFGHSKGDLNPNLPALTTGQRAFHLHHIC